MAVNTEAYQTVKQELDAKQVTLVAVSKTKPVEDIVELYDSGHRDFGENYVQELVDKQAALPKDIRWHFIGHLQSNKVKYIAPFVQLIHGVDSLKLLKEINKEAGKNNRIIDVLLQVHIAQEETKFGLNEEELNLIIQEFENLKMTNVRVCGLMGMASFSDDLEKVRSEFRYLKMLFNKSADKFTIHPSPFTILSMGMSGDYKVAVEEGSTMVRIGSLLFGARNSSK
ncbi:YggS family pyridoxal phosphate-dependent enzyme [Lacibacter sediminis]|uniref:Pyridoxal phosphate homeostasis protein n=1 Tax=Lacibacter sediminis TaxID=2760713 RepID=A0A7G5XBK5_9BACT|nr:YggS family pyridoxal phosphate-dependent enzyme [Lacibacter sediminis]QNA42858.1 YggS family pyridoxal phosphate-dependent enzyme [Lacibacter sediminis]